jgi:hypothetical protein
VDLLILVIADTEHNRAVLDRHRGPLRELLPLDGPDIRRALRGGRLPSASGLITL